jgi:hypothetical protein
VRSLMPPWDTSAEFMEIAPGLHQFENSSIALRDLIERNLEHLAALAGGANAHANLSTILTTLLLAAPAMPYRGAAEDSGPPKYGKTCTSASTSQ